MKTQNLVGDITLRKLSSKELTVSFIIFVAVALVGIFGLWWLVDKLSYTPERAVTLGLLAGSAFTNLAFVALIRRRLVKK